MASKPSATAAAMLLGAAILVATVCARAQTTAGIETCIDAVSDFLSGKLLAPGTIQAAVRGLKPVEVAQCVCLNIAGSIGIADGTPEGVQAVFDAVVRTLNLAVPKGFVCEPVNGL